MTKEEQSLDHSLMSNGLDFVSSGIRSINSGKADEIKYAVLHLFSGAVLILKEKVHQEHWSLLFQKVEEANLAKFNSGDFEGINYRRLMGVLKDVCQITLSEDGLKALEDLRKSRNKVEHFRFEVSVQSIKPVAAKVLSFLIAFIEENLDGASLDEKEQELFTEIKSEARSFKDFVKTRVDHIVARAKLKNQDLFHCPECFEKSMLREDLDFRCYVCDQDGADVENVVATHLEHALNIDYYESGSNGVELPMHTCPECDCDNVLVPENTTYKTFVCVNCAFKCPRDQLHSCSRCGTVFHGVEAGPYCSNCWEDINEE